MRQIELTQGKKSVIDDEDYEWISKYKWCVSQYRNKYYVIRRNPENGKLMRLHREIMKAGIGQEVDHINGDSLDNRKENLRLCTHKQNLSNQKLSVSNTTGYKGVTKRKNYNRWDSHIKVNQKKIHLGSFDDPVSAAHVYNVAALSYFGEFANLNVLQEVVK